MREAAAIAQREYVSMFRVPAGWIIIALFAFLSGVLFVHQTLAPGQPGTMRYFFAASAWLLIPIAPAISMRLLSEELRTGSFEALRTTPAGDWGVTLGKYLGAVAFLATMLVPSLAFPIVLVLVSDPSPDLGPMVSGYLMLVLVGSLYLSIGLLASSLTSSQTLAFLGSIMTLVLLLVVTGSLAEQAPGPIGRVLLGLSITSRAAELSKGVVDTSTIAFFIIGSVWMLAATAAVLETRRLARSRRVVSLALGVFLAATTSAALFLGVLTHRNAWRVDVTALGSHQLSERAQRITARLEGPTRLVLAAELARVDPVTLDLVGDVFDAYERGPGDITSEVIDLGSPGSIDTIGTLMDELRARDAQARERAEQSALDAGAAIRGAAAALDAAAPRVRQAATLVRDQDPGAANNRAYFEQRAALARVQARDLENAAGAIVAAAQDPESRLADACEAPSQTLVSVLTPLEQFWRDTDTLSRTQGLSAALTSHTRALAGEIRAVIDTLAGADQTLASIETLESDRVSRALETGEALLVIGPSGSGIAAVDLQALLPPTDVLRSAGLSPAGIIGPRAQELIASAIAEIVIPERPILVLVHGAAQGEALATPELFARTAGALRERGIDTVEWSAVERAEPPSLSDLDPLGTRPRVYMVLATDTAAQSSGDGPTGARRAEAIGRAVETLVESGESLLVSVNPSVFHSFGSPDPLVRAIEPFGIVPDTSVALLGSRRGASGVVADPASVIVPDTPRDEDTAHPLAGALFGLRTVLPWVVPISIEGRVGVDAWALIEALGREDLWAEHDWLTLWSTPGNARPFLRDQPVFDPSEDDRSDRWTLAAATQRELAGEPQRLVVVGSNAWMTDQIVLGEERLVDGRLTRPYPGNRVLLEGAIAWLSGHDDLIAPGTEARNVATIRALTRDERSRIRWVLLAIIPLGTIIVGLGVRVVFG